MKENNNAESFFSSDSEEINTEEEKEEKEETDSNEKSEKIDWQKKYEALEKETKKSGYLEELRGLDDDLEAQSLDEFEGADKYMQYRDMGLSPKAAYAAITADAEKKSTSSITEKNHINNAHLRRTSSLPRMDKTTKDIVSQILEDVTPDEREALYRRVIEE